MARIPEYRQRELPTTNIGAAPLPVSAADVNAGAIGRGLTGVGQGIGDVGESMFKIKQMDNENKDSLATIKYDSIIEDAEEKQKIYQSNTGDETLWEANRKQLEEAVKKETGNLSWGTKRAQSIAMLTTEKWTNNFQQRTELAAIEKRKIETLKVTESAYVTTHSAIMEGMTPEQVAETKDRQKASEIEYTNALKRSFGPDMVKSKLRLAEIDSSKGQAINLASIGKYKEARELVSTIPFEDPKDRIAMLNSIDAMEAKSIQGNKIAIENELAVIDKAIILPQAEFLAQVPALLEQINTSAILPVKGENGAGKEGQRKKINDRVEAISKGKVDPVTEFDPKAYNDLSIRISRNSASVSDTEISNAVGKGKNGGITVDQKEILFGLKKKYDGGKTEATELHKRYSGAINDLQTAKMFSSNKIENIRLASETQNILDSWTEKHPDATAEDYEKFYNRLIDTSNLSGWYTLFSRKSAESRKAIRGNIEKMKEETKSPTDLSKLSDAELLKRITSD